VVHSLCMEIHIVLFCFYFSRSFYFYVFFFFFYLLFSQNVFHTLLLTRIGWLHLFRRICPFIPYKWALFCQN
jgi:hypothetical protein